MNRICSCFYFSEKLAAGYVQDYNDSLQNKYNDLGLDQAKQALGNKNIAVWTDDERVEKKKYLVNSLRENHGYIMTTMTAFFVAAIAAVIGLKMLAVLHLAVSVALFSLIYRKITPVAQEFIDQELKNRIDQSQNSVLRSSNAAQST